VDLRFGGEQRGGAGLVGGVDRGGVDAQLARGAGDLDASAADQGVGAAQGGDVEARLAVIVDRGVGGAVVPGPGAGGRLDLAAVEGGEDVREVVDGGPEVVAALGHVLGSAVAAGAGVT